MARRRMVAGNWKMNGSLDANASLIRELMFEIRKFPEVDILICPPAVYLTSVIDGIKNSPCQAGAQNLCEQEKAGAFTGEIHGAMIKDVGATHVLVGHSERRTLYGESDEIVARKFKTAQGCGLTPVLCLGETLAQREAGETESVLARQLGAVLELCGIGAFKSAVVAYEPVWAIGTGKTASSAQAQSAHAYIRSLLRDGDAKIADSVRLLYGGSVKADNAAELFANPDVDGGLVGGASLKASDFLSICAAAQSR